MAITMIAVSTCYPCLSLLVSECDHYCDCAPHHNYTYENSEEWRSITFWQIIQISILQLINTILTTHQLHIFLTPWVLVTTSENKPNVFLLASLVIKKNSNP